MKPIGFKVQSSQIDLIGYDENTSKMYISFKPNKMGESSIYEYPSISKQLFDKFMQAKSFGKFLSSMIKPHSNALKLPENNPSDFFSKIVPFADYVWGTNEIAKNLKQKLNNDAEILQSLTPDLLQDPTKFAWCW